MSSVFLYILAKKSVGSVIFSRDGWVTANIHIFFGLIYKHFSSDFVADFEHVFAQNMRSGH